MMNFESTEDALPFFKLPTKTLLLIYKAIKSDESNGFCKNRLYYISNRLKVIVLMILLAIDIYFSERMHSLIIPCPICYNLDYSSNYQ